MDRLELSVFYEVAGCWCMFSVFVLEEYRLDSEFKRSMN